MGEPLFLQIEEGMLKVLKNCDREKLLQKKLKDCERQKDEYRSKVEEFYSRRIGLDKQMN